MKLSRFLMAGCCVVLFSPAALPARAADNLAPAAGAELQADGLALLREWSPPVYPPEALRKRASGMVTVRLIVDETGAVTAARPVDEPDAAFVESAVAAVKSWKFIPATERGEPVACCLETLVAYSPAVGQQKPSPIPPAEQSFAAAPRSAPVMLRSPPGDYPEALVDRMIPGVVRFTCTVLADGKVVQPRVRAASHADFVLPALRSLQNWEFKPAMMGDLPVRAEAEGVMRFESVFGKTAEVLAANGITAADGSPPPVEPEPVIVFDPVCPFDALLKGDAGSATVDFAVSNSGAVHDVRLREASQPEFGMALVAAVEASRFNPAIENNQVVAVTLAKRAEFKSVPVDATDATDPVTRLVIAARRGEIGSAKGLDAKLAPIYRVAPIYPAALKATGGPKGKADIEFVIDRDGRVRLPRIVSATLPEFGWAAAAAVAQWVFVAPCRAGEFVDVKVRMPFEFDAPAG
jgi:TonB family protein